MRRTALLLIMCLASLASVAQSGWYYEDGKAAIMSNEDYVSGDWDNPTTLMLMIGDNKQGSTMAVAMLQGEFSIHNFRAKQHYVVVDFDGEQHRFKVKPIEEGDLAFSGFVILDTASLITQLRTAQMFSITLPLYKHGVRTFIFNTNGYPLDW